MHSLDGRLDMTKRLMARYWNEAEGYYVGPDGCAYGSMPDEDDGVTSLLQVGVLGFCACWTPDENLEYVRAGLRLIANRFTEEFKNEKYEDQLANWVALCGNETSATFFWYWADKQGYTEHGGSIGMGGWLSSSGKQLLADLDEVCDEESAN